MVKARNTSLSKIIFFAVLLAALQILAISHGAAHGDVNHSHDGTPCVFPLSSDSSQNVSAESEIRIIGFAVIRQGLRQQTLSPGLHSGHANGIRAPPDTFPI